MPKQAKPTEHKCSICNAKYATSGAAAACEERHETPPVQEFVVERGIVTRHEPAKHQVDSMLLEKAIEVNRITVNQELDRQITAIIKDIKETEVAIIKQTETLNKSLSSDGLEKFRNDAGINKMAKAIGEIFGGTLSTKKLISSVTLADHEEADKESSGFLKKFNVKGTECVWDVETTCSMLMCPSEKDEEDEGDDEKKIGDHQRISGFCQVHNLTAGERQSLNALRDAAAQLALLKAQKAELEDRLRNSSKQSEALKAQVLTQQIARAEGGAETLELMRQAQMASIQGEYVALL